jgi:hypothetical protein
MEQTARSDCSDATASSLDRELRRGCTHWRSTLSDPSQHLDVASLSGKPNAIWADNQLEASTWSIRHGHEENGEGGSLAARCSVDHGATSAVNADSFSDRTDAQAQSLFAQRSSAPLYSAQLFSDAWARSLPPASFLRSRRCATPSASRGAIPSRST